MEKDYFISALQMFETEGSANIPTVLYYDRSQRVLIGSAALAEGSAEDLNEDFKVDLGNIDPDSKKPRTPFFTASGVPKSAAELTADFLNTLIKDVRKWMDKAGMTGAPSILLAEPLALEGESVSSEWLANYRNNLRRMLVGKGFKSLDFLPEPFAVFQYYRYGARHPLVLQHLKQNVLVVDFGGGTCDVCIVETTKTGDISQSGRNAKPLAAGSKPVGGFFINRIIAEDLLGTFMPSLQQFKLRKAIENYMKWRRGKDDLSTYAQEYRNFIKHFHALIHSVENPKLSLCRSVRDWKLEAALDLKVPTSIPADPFADEPGRKSVSLIASKLRDLFAEKVWRQQLKPLMQQTLERGRSELEGAPISVVLLSGGSANIGWLKELIQYEFGNQALHGADVLPLPDYQEVVAKGLAVECARRFYNETGDFSSVTYNRLCLLLDSDGDGCETRPFLVQTHGLPNVKNTPGLLLPSASVLEEYLGKPIRWKVHFDHPARKFLRYYFLRSSFDPEDAKNVYNVEEQVVFTPPNCPFDANLQVELMVNDDGTARPSFIYKAGSAQFPGAVGKGHPFYLDMTSARNVAHDPEAYIGLDFGTSNSSVSYVDQGSVKVYRLRAEERRWREFTELVDVLPYPLAEPLARYLGQTETLQLTNAALEFIESALALAAYTAYFGFCSQKGRATTKLLGGQRLWFLTQLDPDNASYNMFSAVTLEGPLKLSALEQSIQEIARRHESLRTCFRIEGGQPVQVVREDLDVRLNLVDLRGLPAKNRERQARLMGYQENERAFDLEHGPLLRIVLFWLTDCQHTLLMNVHHIVSDAWSQELLLQELSQLYALFAGGHPSDLPELEIQYADYAVWQEEWLKGEAYHEQLEYWRERLRDFEVLQLPTDNPRPEVQSSRGAMERLSLSGQLLGALRAYAARQGVTLYMVLLAGFVALLQRYSGQREVVIGTPIANRSPAEIEGLIGFFVNTLVLRVKVGEEISYEELVKEVREVCLGAFQHPDVPLDRIVDELQPGRDLSRNPLFQVTFQLLNAANYDLRLKGIQLAAADIENRTAKFDWTMEVHDYGSWLEFRLEYKTDLYNRETMQRALAHYWRLLRSAMADPQQRIAQLELLDAREQAQLVHEWNETYVAYDREKCIHELIEEQARLHPDAVAVVYEDASVTYRVLNEKATQLAIRLRRHGVVPESVVAVCMERSVELVLALLAILKAGGAYLPLDPALPAERLRTMMRGPAAGVFLTQENLLPLAKACGASTVLVPYERDPADESSMSEFRAEAQNLAYVMYTSGSTGTPKGVMITHLSLANHMHWMQERFPLGQGDAVLQKTSFSFDASVWEFWAPLLAGARLVVAQPGRQADPAYIVEVINRESVTTLQVVPIQLQMLLEEGLNPCRTLRRVFCGGGPLTEELCAQFSEQLPIDLVNLYGPTEATIEATCWQMRSDRESRRKIPIGRPISNTNLYVLDGEGELVPQGIPGELCIAGEGLARGYTAAPAVTATKFVPNPYGTMPGSRVYRSGDICRYALNGELEFIGRRDQQIKLHGYRVELTEIEAVLRRSSDVRHCTVAIRDIQGVSRIVAYVVPHRGDLDVAELREFVKRQLPEYMVPAAWVPLDKLPLTASGKLDPRQLPVPVAGHFSKPRAFVAAGSEQQRIVARIWEEVLNIDRVGVEDNFFEAGGHSLLLTTMSRRLTEALGRKVAILDLFRFPTIQSFTESLDRGTRDRNLEAQETVHEKLTAGQQRREQKLLLLQHDGGAAR